MRNPFRSRGKDALEIAEHNTESLNALREIYETGQAPTSINETQKQGLDILVPEEPQKNARRAYIALFSGEAKDYIDVLTASIELAGWDALARGEPVPDIPANIMEQLTELSSSIDGHRAKEVVEVARSTQAPEKPKKRGWL